MRSTDEERVVRKVTTDDVRAYWQAHPLNSEAIPFEPGTPEFFRAHERMRFDSEPAEIQEKFYRWRFYAGKRLLDVGCGMETRSARCSPVRS